MNCFDVLEMGEGNYEQIHSLWWTDRVSEREGGKQLVDTLLLVCCCCSFTELQWWIALSSLASFVPLCPLLLSSNWQWPASAVSTLPMWPTILWSLFLSLKQSKVTHCPELIRPMSNALAGALALPWTFVTANLSAAGPSSAAFGFDFLVLSLSIVCMYPPLLAVIWAGICLSIATNLLAMDPSAAMPLSYPMAIESIHRTLVLILSFSLFCSLLSLPPSFFIIFSMAPFHRSQPASLLLLLLLLLYGRRELWLRHLFYSGQLANRGTGTPILFSSHFLSIILHFGASPSLTLPLFRADDDDDDGLEWVLLRQHTMCSRRCVANGRANVKMSEQISGWKLGEERKGIRRLISTHRCTVLTTEAIVQREHWGQLR